VAPGIREGNGFNADLRAEGRSGSKVGGSAGAGGCSGAGARRGLGRGARSSEPRRSPRGAAALHGDRPASLPGRDPREVAGGKAILLQKQEQGVWPEGPVQGAAGRELRRLSLSHPCA